jgi:hypothetical protein
LGRSREERPAGTFFILVVKNECGKPAIFHEILRNLYRYAVPVPIYRKKGGNIILVSKILKYLFCLFL